MKFPPHPLTRDQMDALLRVCGTNLSGTRNRALLALIYRTGIRISEACRLMMADIERRDGVIYIRISHTKTNLGHRDLALDDRAMELLELWLKVRGEEIGPVFHTRTGELLQTSYVRQLLPRLAKRAKLRRRVHAHALRHTFARELYDEGVGIVEIQLALGHTTLDTTQKYLKSIGAHEVNAALRKRRW